MTIVIVNSVDSRRTLHLYQSEFRFKHRKSKEENEIQGSALTRASKCINSHIGVFWSQHKR